MGGERRTRMIHIRGEIHFEFGSQGTPQVYSFSQLVQESIDGKDDQSKRTEYIIIGNHIKSQKKSYFTHFRKCIYSVAITQDQCFHTSTISPLTLCTLYDIFIFYHRYLKSVLKAIGSAQFVSPLTAKFQK